MATAIAVGTDFSKHAEEAVQVAVALGRRLDAGVCLGHVVDPLTLDDAQLLQRGLLASAEQRLTSAQSRVKSEGANVRADILTGSPDEALIEYAGRVDARLLVVSALGWQSGERWRLGSVTERVAQTARCPLLVIREAEPFLEWTRGQRPLRVMVADDFSNLAAGALRWLGELRKLGPCEVTVAHVYSPGAEQYRLGLCGERLRTMETLLLTQLKERLAALGEAGAQVRLVPSFGRPAEPLVELAQAERADLLVLGTHQRHRLGRVWHGSVSHSLLHLAPMAVALVPEQPHEPTVQPIAAIRRVLVTTDFSEAGNHAVSYAYGLLPSGGDLHLVYVQQVPSVALFPEAVPGYVPNLALTSEQREVLRRRLEQLIPPEAEARGIRSHAEVAEGAAVATAICQAAERLRPDILCISSHGRTGVARVVMGSVAQSVLARSTRPVLVVRPQSST